MSVGGGPDRVLEPDELLDLARGLRDRAQAGEQVEVVLAQGSGTTVKVFGGEVESLTVAGASGAGIRIVRDGRQGFAHCGSLDADVLDDTLAEARDNAGFAEPDEWNGLAEPDGVEPVPVDRWSEAVLALPTETKVAFALELERRVTSADPRVTSARTTGYGDGWSVQAIASTTGIEVADRGASCSASTQPLARAGDETQIGWGFDAGRDPELLDRERVVAEAVERATRMLGATKPASSRRTILLDPRMTATLLGVVSGMLCGDQVVKGRSPFADRLGEQVASPLLTLGDDPTRTESLAADSHDGEGLACRPNPLIVGGTLDRFLHDSYSGRRSGSASTGSAVRGTRSTPGVGAQLLVVEPGGRSFEELVASIGHGLWVTTFSGLHSGVNPTSGDFSVGAEGILIEDGTLSGPVREVTVASTIQRLLLDVREVGGDLEWLPGGDGSCSLVIDDVSVAGT